MCVFPDQSASSSASTSQLTTSNGPSPSSILPVGTEVNTAVSIHETIPIPIPSTSQSASIVGEVTFSDSDDEDTNDDSSEATTPPKCKTGKTTITNTADDIEDVDDYLKFESDKLFEHVNQRFVGHRNARLVF